MNSARNSDHLFLIGEVVTLEGAEVSVAAIEAGHQNPSGQAIDMLTLSTGQVVGSDRVDVVE